MHKNTRYFFIFCLLPLVFTGCVKTPESNIKHIKVNKSFVYNEKNYRIDKKAKVVIGNASYYANCMNGRYTASGEVCNLSLFTAAHRSLPFGTIIKVTMLQNGKSVIVKVNDRGSYVKGRVIDISIAAARKIGLISAGVAKVKIEKLERLH